MHFTKQRLAHANDRFGLHACFYDDRQHGSRGSAYHAILGGRIFTVADYSIMQEREDYVQ